MRHGPSDVERSRAPHSQHSYLNDPSGVGVATPRRAWAAKFTVSALVLVGVGALGSVLWLKRVEPGLPNASPVATTTQSPNTTEPVSHSTVATSSEAAATPKEVAQPAPGKAASAEDQRTGANARVWPNNTPQSALAPTADTSAAKPLSAVVDPPAVAPPVATTQPMASQSPDLALAPAVLLPPASAPVVASTPSKLKFGHDALN